jgi:PAS domain S-box-containing protein
MGFNQGADSSTAEGMEIPLDTLPLHSTDLITVLDETGVIQYESPSVECIFGFEQSELIGEQITDYIHPDDLETVTNAFQAVVSSKGDTIETVEYRHKQADGTYLWVESVSSSNSMSGEQYVVNTRNISDRKEYEQQLLTANTRLEEFANVVSHDLRNPLHVAQSRLQLAQSECDSEHLEDVADAHDRMAALIDDLRALSQIEDEVSETEIVDLGTLSARCWQRVPTGEATLATKTDQHLQANRSRLAQLLENLFRNAIEHGGADVTVTVGEIDDGFYVEDDGSGIPEEERGDVFEAGYSNAEDGTGFGLSIVKQVLDAHGWDVRVTDGSDGGARFEITGVKFIAE